MEKKGDDIVFCGEKVDSRAFEGPLWPFLRERLQSYASHIALVNPYTKEELSYARVLSLAERLSRGLYKLGLRQGSAVCFCAPNSVENALLTLATFAVRGVLHGINPSSVPVEIRRQLDLTEAQMIITVPQLLGHVEKAVAGTSVRILVIGPRNGQLNYDDILALGTEDVTIETSPEDPANSVACVMFSSGTTGLPKGVEITQRNIRALFYIFSVHDGGFIKNDDVSVLFLPFFHIYGLTATLLANLAIGAKSVIMSSFDMNNFLTFCASYKASVLFLVPPVIVGMLNHPRLSDFDLSSVRVAFSGAAPLGKETEAQFVRKLGVPCLQGYGMTENLVASVSSNKNNKIASSGKTLSGTEFKIVDSETGKSLGVNQEGVVHMRGPLLMRGYLKNPQATRDTIDSNGWLNSGDIGKFDSDGYLFIVDRQKELMKYKGEQVPPAVLEDVLLSHPAISDACVVGRPDTAAGELPMAFVVMATGHSLTAQQVQEFVAGQVPSYMRLRGGVEFIKEIPKSPSGKILRRVLREEVKQKVKAKL